MLAAEACENLPSGHLLPCGRHTYQSSSLHLIACPPPQHPRHPQHPRRRRPLRRGRRAGGTHHVPGTGALHRQVHHVARITAQKSLLCRAPQPCERGKWPAGVRRERGETAQCGAGGGGRGARRRCARTWGFRLCPGCPAIPLLLGAAAAAAAEHVLELEPKLPMRHADEREHEQAGRAAHCHAGKIMSISSNLDARLDGGGGCRGGGCGIRVLQPGQAVEGDGAGRGPHPIKRADILRNRLPIAPPLSYRHPRNGRGGRGSTLHAGGR